MKIVNKKAFYNYHILEKMEAGIVLEGSEVKSLRDNRADLSDAFARLQGGELFLKNAYIYPYKGGVKEGYAPKRDRKLLLHRKQLDSLVGKVGSGGKALIPLSIYSTRNFIKVELAVAVSKKKVDKKRAIKEKDELKRLEQELRGEKAAFSRESRR